MNHLVIRADAVLVDGSLRPAAVEISEGRIVGIHDHDAVLEVTAQQTLPAGQALLPGLVDSHVHINEPGRTEWEGFDTATRAALAGGVTTLIDMPLNSIPPTTSPANLAVKQAAASGSVHVDVGFWGGAVPENLGSLRALHEAGVFGFKCFLAPSGVDEFGHLEPEQLRAALAEVAAFDGLLIVHAEDPGVLDAHEGPGGRRYADFEASRPEEAELVAIRRVIEGVRETGARAHILHLSAAAAIAELAEAQAEGLRITAETCPHYLTLTADEIPDGGTHFKCCPPIRGRANQDVLWAALAAGTIACVVSDHSPSTADLKFAHDGDFALAWGGIAGLQLGLSAMWTAASARGVDLATVVGWMSAGPADLVGLADRGRIAVGARADLVAFDPAVSRTVDVAALEHRNPVSAYAGRELLGRVERVWQAGAPALLARP